MTSHEWKKKCEHVRWLKWGTVKINEKWMLKFLKGWFALDTANCFVNNYLLNRNSHQGDAWRLFEARQRTVYWLGSRWCKRNVGPPKNSPKTSRIVKNQWENISETIVSVPPSFTLKMYKFRVNSLIIYEVYETAFEWHKYSNNNKQPKLSTQYPSKYISRTKECRETFWTKLVLNPDLVMIILPIIFMEGL